MTSPWRWRQRSAWLARRLSPQSAGPLLGDLHEEFGARLARDGRVRAEWWLSRELGSLARAYRRSDRSVPAARRTGWIRRSEATQVLRSLRRSPWYAITAVAVIAIAVALGTSVFAIVDGTLFKPLPYSNSSNLFAVVTGYSRLAEPLGAYAVSPADLAEWRTALPGVLFSGFSPLDTVAIGTHDSVQAARVDRFFFDAVGVAPVVGGFGPADFLASSPVRPAVITAAFWRSRFGADLNIVGRVIVDDTGSGIRIVGILPPSFVFPYPSREQYTPELLTPWVENSPLSRGAILQVIARLSAADVTGAISSRINSVVVAQAAARIPPTLPPNLPERARIVRAGRDRAALKPIRDALTGELRERAWVVFWAASALVLLACLNVAGLVVGRTRDRERDLVVRRALGARTSDLVRLLALETTLVVIVGAMAGSFLATMTLPTTTRLLTGFMKVIKPPVIDWRVAMFAAISAALSALLITLLAARSVVRADVRHSLGDARTSTHRIRRRLSLISCQVAVACVVMVGASLVVGSLLRAWLEDPGFDVQNTAVLQMAAPRGSSSAEIEALVSDVSRLPGVAHAGVFGHALLERAFNGSEFDTPAGVAPQSFGPESFPIESVPVSHGFFAAAGLTAHEGRLPTDAELLSGSPVVVVSDLVARLYWPGQHATGHSLVHKGRAFDVIGVVGDARFMSLDMDPQGAIYWPLAATPRGLIGHMLVRFSTDRTGTLDTLVPAVRERCPGCWLISGSMMTDLLGETIRGRRFSAWLFSAFGLAGLAIVGAGIFGVVAMTTMRRTREIGIRVALGASRGDVVRQLLREHLTAVTAGLLIGGLVSGWATRFVTGYLYRTPTYDPLAWGVAAAALLVVAGLGALVPARRASRIDPIRALHSD